MAGQVHLLTTDASGRGTPVGAANPLPTTATGLPASVGQKTASASLPVVLASNQSAVPVAPAAGETHLGAVGGALKTVSVEVTRPSNTTAYAAKDVVDGDPVATWSDLSGNGNHATQATASKKPTYKTSIVNGRPVVRFDGVDDWLGCTLAGVSGNASRTAIVAFRATDAVSGDLILHVGDAATSGGSFGVSRNTSNKWSVFQWGGASFDLSSAADANSSYHILTVLKNENDLSLFIDGTLTDGPSTKSTATLASSNARLGTLLDSTQPLNGDIAEIILCSNAVALGYRQMCERYLGQKYGIAIS
jgi:hypothetical protein